MAAKGKRLTAEQSRHCAVWVEKARAILAFHSRDLESDQAKEKVESLHEHANSIESSILGLRNQLVGIQDALTPIHSKGVGGKMTSAFDLLSQGLIKLTRSILSGGETQPSTLCIRSMITEVQHIGDNLDSCFRTQS